MIHITLVITSYLNIVLVALYTLTCFQLIGNESKTRSKKLFARQNRVLLLFHFFANLDIILQMGKMKYIYLYGAELLFLLTVMIFYHRMLKGVSRVITNNMLFFMVVGMVMLTRLSFEDYAVKQFVTLVLCFALSIVVALLMKALPIWRRLTWIYGIGGFFLLATVAVWGVDEYGATNWISIHGITLQPSEFAKLIFVLFVACRLSKTQDLKSLVVTTIIAASYVIVLVLERDLGAALIFFVTYIIMLYVATGRLTLLVVGFGSGAVAAVVAFKLFTHVQNRVIAFKDPWAVIDGVGYQICQSLFAFGTGSWFGVGVGEGKADAIPVVYSDFILSAIAEEFGTIFVLCVLLIFLACFIMFLNASMKSSRPLYKLIALGMGVCFIFQVFLNVGGAVKFIPLTGVTLPLISYGRSSVASVMLLFGIVQGILIISRSDRLAKEKGESFDEDDITITDIKNLRKKKGEDEESPDLDAEDNKGDIFDEENAIEDKLETDAKSKKEHGFIYMLLNSFVRTSKKLKINRQVTLTAYVFVFLFIGLMGYISYYVAVPSKADLASSYNPRKDLFKDKIIKGKIITSDGKTVAKSVKGNGSYVRNYPYDSLFAQTVGYDINGKAGLEASANYYLYSSHASLFERISNDLSEKKNRGDDVHTTLDYDLQKAAYDALGSSKGAVVVLEPDTGRILAMVSKPDYNPNTIETVWEELNKVDDSALLNRATRGLYPPGSTFKIVTALEYVKEHEKDWKNYSYNCEGSSIVSGVSVRCSGGHVHGKVSLRDAMAYSCNNAFVDIGMKLDIGEYRKTATSLLYNSEMPIEFEYSKSRFELTSKSDRSEIPQTSFGQGDTLCTPLLNAMTVATIANDGVMMKPYLLDSIESYDGRIVKEFKPEEYSKVMSEHEANVMNKLLTGVVEYGTASKLAGLKHSYAGKTGTAETGEGDNTHAWFVGYSNVEDPDIAISVLVENGGSGSAVAVPIAEKVFTAYYNKHN
ncbi:MAG: FtsW/RodA/SpoVE family cell cycle protein [Lachnospiraceae bacterium]|nr:FtsW/RodA/SpoVE family cell cycle protein [Lachnospiraceae bacterium]